MTKTRQQATAWMRRVAMWMAVLLAMAAPAAALDAEQAGRIVGLMEQISAQSGEVVYHGAGDAFFELDTDGLIGAAGFERQQWAVLFDEVVIGYMATIPQDEFDAMFAELLVMLETSALTDEQKQSLRVDMEQEIGMAQQARRDGAVHADAVRGLADRLHVLFFG